MVRVRRIKTRLEFKPEDFWIGVFWRKQRAPKVWMGNAWGETVDVWVCLLPMLPIHIHYFDGYKRADDPGASPASQRKEA